jgi:hypothetical protein
VSDIIAVLDVMRRSKVFRSDSAGAVDVLAGDDGDGQRGLAVDSLDRGAGDFDAVHALGGLREGGCGEGSGNGCGEQRENGVMELLSGDIHGGLSLGIVGIEVLSPSAAAR